MGSGLQILRAKAFKHKGNKAKEELLESQNLFSNNPEILRHVFKCIPTNDQHTLAVGDTVFITDQGEELVRVLYDKSHIGNVDASGSKLLRKALFSIPDAQNVTVGTVHSLATLTKKFSVVLDDPNAP